TSSDSQAVLPANYSFAAGDVGVHSFSATLKTAGLQCIMAADTTNGGISGSQSGITVIPAAASTLTVMAPASVNAGAAFSVTITAKDAYANIASGYVGQVRFTSTDPHAVLPANYTFTAGDSGSHTFTNGATLKTAGSQ